MVKIKDVVKLSPSDMNDMINEYPDTDPLHSRQKDIIQMLTAWGNELGHETIGRLAGMIDVANRSADDRKKLAEYKKQQFTDAGHDVPSIVSSIASA